MTDPMTSAQAKLDLATENFKKSRTKKKKKVNASALEAIYRDAMSIAYTEQPAPAWRVKDLASVKRAFDRVTTNSEWLPFMEFIVYEWDRIIKSYLGWIKDKPKSPRLALIISQIDRFYEAYIDDINPNREFKAALRKGGDTKRDEREAALVAETQALKSEITKTRKKLVTAERGLQNEKRKTRKLKLKKQKNKTRKAEDYDLKGWDD